MASLEGMRDRTVTINGMSKTYSVTGWRVGWAVAPPAVTDAIRKVHDFLTVGAPAPLQQAGAAALGLLALGWWLRHRNNSYALMLQGTGIAVLYLTVFAAMRLHPLLDPSAALGLLVAVTVLPWKEFLEALWADEYA